MESTLSKSYSEYISIMFQVGVDLHFWNTFIKERVKIYQTTELTPREIYSSIFGAYDIDLTSNTGFLRIYNESKSINMIELQEYREKFFSWVINCSIVRAYIAVETAFIQTIWAEYFPTLGNPFDSKGNLRMLINAIKLDLTESGIQAVTTNNRHLIEFFKLKSVEYEKFILKPIRIDLQTNWAQFFEMFSLLRNIVSHIGSKVSIDLENRVKGIAKDVFNRHFQLIEDDQGYKHLQANQDRFQDFLFLVNDFTLNSLKIIRNEKNFDFLKMK